MSDLHARSRWFAIGLAWLLLLSMLSVVAATRFDVEEQPVQVQLLPPAGGAPVDSPEGTIALAGQPGQDVVARLRFQLPPVDRAQSRWVIRLARNPVRQLWLQRGPWQSVHRDFFHPAASEGLMPAAFVLPLPIDWAGETELLLHARGDIRTTLRPRLMREAPALRLGQRAVGFDSAIYAGLFVLALVALALYSSAREYAFLALFGCTTVALLLLAGENGHLYALPGAQALALWQGEGLWALEMLFCATALQMLMRYADLRDGMTRATRWVDGYCLGLAALAALSLLDLATLHAVLQQLVTWAWFGTGIACAVVLGGAARRGVPMAWPVLLLTMLSSLAMAIRYASALGLVGDDLWPRHGYELAFAATTAMVTIGLVSRIGEYRDQRDHARLARLDTERRMARESARSELTLALQTRLRSLAPGDIEWTAFHLLLEHLLPQVPVHAAAVWAHGYHGRDLLLVEPSELKQDLHDQLAGRTLSLKRQASTPVPLQQHVAGHPEPMMEAVLPLPIRAPGWGVLLLQRAGSEGFTTQELDLAGEFARLAVLHADETLAAVQLRRSAELDALTGSFNRRSIDQWMARMFTDAHRNQRPLSLLFIDIDHFKSINDQHGHSAGDHCLREVALALRQGLDANDVLGRYGGEEFVVLLPERGGADAREIGERLRAAVERALIQWKTTQVPLTVSVGVATRLERESTPAAAIERADKALYAAKRGGRNCVHVAPAVFS